MTYAPSAGDIQSAQRLFKAFKVKCAVLRLSGEEVTTMRAEVQTILDDTRSGKAARLEGTELYRLIANDEPNMAESIRSYARIVAYRRRRRPFDTVMAPFQGIPYRLYPLQKEQYEDFFTRWLRTTLNHAGVWADLSNRRVVLWKSDKIWGLSATDKDTCYTVSMKPDCRKIVFRQLNQNVRMI